MDPIYPLRVCPQFKFHWVSNNEVVLIKRYDHDRPYIRPKEIFAILVKVFVSFNIQEHYVKFKDEDGDLVDFSLYDNLSFQFDNNFNQFYLYIFTSKLEAQNFVLPCSRSKRIKPSGEASVLRTQDESGREGTIVAEPPPKVPAGANSSSGAPLLKETPGSPYESAWKLVLTSATGNYHKNVYCNGCLGDVPSNRYKCLECPNFDLCARCEAKGVHPEHLMVRVSQSFIHSNRSNLHDVIGETLAKAAKRRR